MTLDRSTRASAGTRRELLRSLALLPGLGVGTGTNVQGTATESDLPESDPPGAVHCGATTLTLLPASEECIDPPVGATGDEAWDGDCEDTTATADDADADRKRHHALASAMPDHGGSTLDAWFIADQTPRLPRDLSTARSIRKDPAEYDGEEFRQYRVRNHLSVSLPSADGATIDDWDAVRIDSSEDDPPPYVLVEGEPGEDNALRDLIEDAPEVPEPEVQRLFDELEGSEKLRATTTVYNDCEDGRPASRASNRVEVDGVEGVRVTQVYGGADTYVLLLKEVYDALHDRYDPVTANRKFRRYTGVEFEAIPAFLVRPPTMYTFLDLVVTADGARVTRVWDASPYPKHYLYLDGRRVDDTPFEEGEGLDPVAGTVRDGDWHPREDVNQGPFAQWVAEAHTSASPFGPGGPDHYEGIQGPPVMRRTESGRRLDGERLRAATATPQYPWD